MRLINTSTYQLEEFMGTEIPKYAILSHTWGEQEISFKEFNEMGDGPLSQPAEERYQKIFKTCEIAAKADLQYVWIDTCCIDKSSSAELTEAINSMYNWYRRSDVCYAYLSDLKPNAPLDALQDCRWFYRGWTLQELIAPEHVIFLDQKWNVVGTKTSLVQELSTRTGISRGILFGDQQLSSISVAQKMSWAADRETTRIEDKAYCLLGIFEINMRLLYGEEGRAFRRLQEEILRRVHDLSIFAWKRPRPANWVNSEGLREYCGVLADSPFFFRDCGSYIKRRTHIRQDIHASNGRITTRMQLLIELRPGTGGYRYVLPVDCSRDSSATLGVRLRKYGPNEFVRENSWQVEEWDNRTLFRSDTQKERHLLAEAELPRQIDPGLPDLGTHFFIGQQRSHALQIKLPTGMWPHLFHAEPGYRFDGEDQLFLTDDPEYDSATVRFRGSIAAPTQDRGDTDIAFECVFCALGWSSTDKGSLQCSLLDYRAYRTALADLKSDVSGWDYKREPYLRHLVYYKIPKAPAVVMEIPGIQRFVKVSFKPTLVEDRSICRNRFWVIEFFCEFYERENVTVEVNHDGWEINM